MSYCICSGGGAAVFLSARHCYRLFGLIHSAILEAKSLELLMASMAMGYAFLENHPIGTAVDCGVGSMLTYKETQVIATKICL